MSRGSRMRFALYAIAGLLACRSTPVVDRLFEDGFEEQCDSGPCGWTLLPGAGSATFTSTIHEAEHGVLFEGESTIRYATPTEPEPISINLGAIEVAVSARCDEGSRLEFEAGLVNPETAVAETFRGTLFPSDEWGRFQFTTLVGDDALSGTGISSAAMNVFIDARLLSLSVRHVGPGVCELDHIAIDTVGEATDVPPTGCD